MMIVVMLRWPTNRCNDSDQYSNSLVFLPINTENESGQSSHLRSRCGQGYEPYFKEELRPPGFSSQELYVSV